MTLNIKHTVISMNYTYELQDDRLSIIDNNKVKTLDIIGKDLQDLREFFNKI